MTPESSILYPEITTPAVLIDLNKLEANIKKMSDLAKSAGAKLRVHVKVHMCAEIAKMQIAAGASGIELGTVGGAEVMAEAGLNDILISHPWIYAGKTLEKLKSLLRKPGLKLGVVVDMLEQAEIISQAGQEMGRKVPTLLKIDVNPLINGFSRFGVPPGAPALALAKELYRMPGIEFNGIYAHEMSNDTAPEALDRAAFKAAEIVTETARLIKKNGIPLKEVAVGSSPTVRQTSRYMREGKFREITEFHPGNFVIGDLIYMGLGGNTLDMIASTVLVTAISAVHADHAVIDTGFKTFGGDYNISEALKPDYWWNNIPSFGRIVNRPDLRCGALAAETGIIYYMDPQKKLKPGERMEIIPTNTTLVISMHDQVYGVRDSKVEKVFTINGRKAGY